MSYHNGMFVGLLVLLLISSPSFAQKQIDKDLMDYVKKEIVKKEVILRGSIHQNPKSYFDVDKTSFYYEHSRRYRNIFRIKKDEPVTITSVTIRGDELELYFKSNRLGKGLVIFSSPLHSPPLNQEAFNKGFNICFSAGGNTEHSSAFIGNTQSKMYHVSGCNHLPTDELNTNIESEENGKSMGYTPCKLCFLQVPLVTDFATERSMGLYASKEILAFGQLATDDALQKRATSIGQRVLDNWPTPLQGYNYTFSVMENNEINAYALPTGFVYVNRGLLEMAESDLEIEAVIAHEIAHVERRHSYRIYRRQQKQQSIATGIGLLAAAIAGTQAKENKAEKATIAGQIAYMFSASISSILYEGYPRSMEEEADAVAALYLERSYGPQGIEAMVRSMKKLRYFSDYVGSEEKKLQAFSSHPLLDDRIAAFSGSKVRFFQKPFVIIGVNKEEEEVVRIEISCQRWTSAAVATRYSLDTTQFLGRLTATADILQPRQFKDITITTESGKKIRLDNKEDSLIGPYEDEGFLLRGELPDALDELAIKEAYVTMPGSGLDWKVEP